MGKRLLKKKKPQNRLLKKKKMRRRRKKNPKRQQNRQSPKNQQLMLRKWRRTWCTSFSSLGPPRSPQYLHLSETRILVEASWDQIPEYRSQMQVPVKEGD